MGTFWKRRRITLQSTMAAHEGRKPGLARVLPSLFPLALMLWAFALAESLSSLCMLLFAVLSHEGGHLLAFYLLGAFPKRPRGALGGLVLPAGRPLSPWEEAGVLLSGPLTNLLLGGLSLLFLPLLPQRAVLSLSIIQFLTGLCNLFPLSHTDGGGLLYLLLSRLWSPRVAGGILSFLSLFLGGLFFFCALFLFYYGRVSLTLPLFAAATLLRITEGSQG